MDTVGHRVSSNTWRLWREMRPYAWHLVALFVFSLLATPLALLTPLPLKIAVDNINARPLPSFLASVLPSSIAHSDRTVLAMAVGLLVAVALLNGCGSFAFDVRSRSFNEVDRPIHPANRRIRDDMD